jgi:hypothetical protein
MGICEKGSQVHDEAPRVKPGGQPYYRLFVFFLNAIRGLNKE